MHLLSEYKRTKFRDLMARSVCRVDLCLKFGKAPAAIWYLSTLLQASVCKSPTCSVTIKKVLDFKNLSFCLPAQKCRRQRVFYVFCFSCRAKWGPDYLGKDQWLSGNVNQAIDFNGPITFSFTDKNFSVIWRPFLVLFENNLKILKIISRSLS